MTTTQNTTILAKVRFNGTEDYLLAQSGDTCSIWWFGMGSWWQGSTFPSHMAQSVVDSWTADEDGEMIA